MAHHYQITLRKLLEAVFWTCVGLAGVAATMSLVPLGSKTQITPHYIQDLELAGVFVSMFAAGAAFGAAIKAFSGAQGPAPIIIGAVLWPAILICGAMLGFTFGH
jgi:hypothetical protein